MGEKLLVNERIDAGACFIRDFNDYVPVSVACWVAPADTTSVYLYVASDDINDSNRMAAYGEVLRRLSSKRSPWLDPFQIKLVNSSDPVARQAMATRDRFSTGLPIPYDGSSIGGLGIDEAWIYPPISTMTAAP